MRWPVSPAVRCARPRHALHCAATFAGRAAPKYSDWVPGGRPVNSSRGRLSSSPAGSMWLAAADRVIISRFAFAVGKMMRMMERLSARRSRAVFRRPATHFAAVSGFLLRFAGVPIVTLSCPGGNPDVLPRTCSAGFRPPRIQADRGIDGF